MFTGIIEEVGKILSFERGDAGNARVVVECAKALSGTATGDSIAVNGVCLTALNLTPESFSADLAPETLERTNLGDLRPGSLVNLERPLQLSSRLSGHIVQGHVDGAGKMLSLEQLGEDNWWLKVEVPAELDPYIVFKGSIALDGISLTCASIEDRVLGVTIIPHTIQHTALRACQAGCRINIETDILAKHMEKLMRRPS